ncbi:MAG: PA0069 family radical SAM protein [Casimicrobiaceae bacterium]
MPRNPAKPSNGAPRAAERGRGATYDPANRFRRDTREEVDDGWTDPRADNAAPPPRKTVVTIQASRTIISRNASPDIPFTQSINPYQGCEHGCIYCFARPTHAYHDLSPGLDFETRLFAKPNAPELLLREIGKRGYVCDPIAFGTNTDPYQPIEREWKITRALLEILAQCRHPFTIVTKSALVERDLDIIAPMAHAGMARVYVSITTLDKELARKLEPRAAAPQRRLQTVAALAAAGVPVGVMVAPVIPQLTDCDLESIVDAAAKAGAQSAGWVMLRLPLEVAPLFRAWLDEHYPQRAAHIMSLVQQIRGGRDNDSTFGTRMRGSGTLAELLAQRFRIARARNGMGDHRADPLDISQFVPPHAADDAQLALFG